MPYLNISLSNKISEQQKNEIAAAAGSLIGLLPGKSETSLMIRIDSDTMMYFRGVAENCAYISLSLYQMSTYEKKGEFAKALVEAVGQIADIRSDNIFMTFSEFGNWVVGGAIQ